MMCFMFWTHQLSIFGIKIEFPFFMLWKTVTFFDIKIQCIIKLVMFRWFFDAPYRTLSLSWTLCDNLCQMYMSETTSKWQKNHFQSRLSIFEWRDWKCIFRAIELCFVSYNISIYITLYYFSKIISRFLRSPLCFLFKFNNIYITSIFLSC